jgi:phage tail sheath protein FI
MRPGVEVISREAAPPRSAPTDPSVAFIATIAQKGSHLVAALVSSLDGFTSQFGDRVTNGWGYDVLDQAFREGLSRAYVIRAVGPAPVYATLNLAGTTGTLLRADAKSVGAWANGAAGGVTVEVANGPSGATHKQIIVRYGSPAAIVETSPEYLNATAHTDLAAWSATSSYITLTVMGGTAPLVAAAAASLAGGTDDVASITDADWETALGKFGAGLGPGQVSMPGRTTTQAHLDTLEHAAANNRVAILDAPDTALKATLTGAAAALSTAGNARRRGGMFAPWVKVAGSAAGTLRTVPPSAIVLGRIAATDRLAGAGQPAAGEYGRSTETLELVAQFSDADAQEIEAPDVGGFARGAVNLLRVINQENLIYGWRTLVDKAADPNWWALSWPRLDMAIKAQSRAIGDRFAFRQIDGRNHTINAFGGELEGMLNRFYLDGALYGDPDDDRPGTAYRVDVGDQVNTEESKAAGELKAALVVRMSPFGELVRIEVTKVLSTQSVA